MFEQTLFILTCSVVEMYTFSTCKKCLDNFYLLFQAVHCYMITYVAVFFLFPLGGDDNDIIDESMSYFKANVFFKSYEVKVCTCANESLLILSHKFTYVMHHPSVQAVLWLGS